MIRPGSDIEGFFNPESVAVVGASRSGTKLGNVPIANMRRFGYGGRVYPIHQGAGEIMGLRAYPSMSAVREKIDVAVAVIPRERIVGFVDECASSNVRRVIVTAAGFADSGGDGARLQEELRQTAAGRGVRLVGPNSVGTISTESGFVTSLLTLDRIKPGGISIVAQTGLFAAGYARWLGSSQQFGLARVACLGNKADVEEVEVLEYLGSDPLTRVVAMYTEGVRDGRRLLEVVRTITPEKPVVVLKGGRTEEGVAAAGSHTGSMAGSGSIYAGAMAQAGATWAGSVNELFDIAKTFEYCPLPAGPGVGVVSVTGAGCVLAADACGGSSLRMPGLKEAALRLARAGLPEWAVMGNPADIWPAVETKGMAAAYDSVARAMAEQEGIDTLMAVVTVVPEAEFDAAGVLGGLKEDYPGKPVMACLMGASDPDERRWRVSLEEAGIPVFGSVERGVRAASALAGYAEWRRKHEKCLKRV